VLELAGGLPDTIEGGEIVRDDKGAPTGKERHNSSIFCEHSNKSAQGVFVDNAMSLISVPPWTERQLLEYFNTTMTEALSYGLTSIHDADSTPQAISFFKKYVNRQFNK
jgi:predicted amidohydrolase YtcJ